jgi:hypothetical protein
LGQQRVHTACQYSALCGRSGNLPFTVIFTVLSLVRIPVYLPNRTAPRHRASALRTHAFGAGPSQQVPLVHDVGGQGHTETPTIERRALQRSVWLADNDEVDCSCAMRGCNRKCAVKALAAPRSISTPNSKVEYCTHPRREANLQRTRTRQVCLPAAANTLHQYPPLKLAISFLVIACEFLIEQTRNKILMRAWKMPGSCGLQAQYRGWKMPGSCGLQAQSRDAGLVATPL